MLSKSTSTCSRPSTSSTCTGRIWPARSRSPEMSSYKPGSVFTGTFAACAASTTWRRISPEADGIAISTSSGLYSRTKRGSSAIVPRTRTPRMRVFRLRSSSSTKPIGVYASSRERCISWTIRRPASPAPTTMTSLPRATTPPRGRSITVRASSRAPATSASVMRRSVTAIERGSRTLCTGEAR